LKDKPIDNIKNWFKVIARNVSQNDTIMLDIVTLVENSVVCRYMLVDI
jgi:hypothetical protein